MAKTEKYFIGPQLLGDLRQVIARVSGAADKTSGAHFRTALQDLPRGQKKSKYFRLKEELQPCLSAAGIEVQLKTPECLVFEDADDALDDQVLYDVSNAVRVFNLVSQRTIDEVAEVGTVVEAVLDGKTDAESGEADTFWRILQVMSCECGSSSSSSSSSSDSSSSQSSDSESSDSSGSGGESSDSSGSGGECVSTVIGGIDLATLPVGDASSLIGIDGNGCLVRIETTDCGSGSGS